MLEWPPNYLVYTKGIVTGVLQLFHNPNYFTWSQLRGDTCPFHPGFPSLCCVELRPI
jgi:hypothetical protein